MRVRDVAAMATALCGAYFFLERMDMEIARDLCPKLMFLLTGASGLVGMALVGLYKFQNHLLYFPNIPEDSRTKFTAPEDYEKKDAFEEVRENWNSWRIFFGDCGDYYIIFPFSSF